MLFYMLAPVAIGFMSVLQNTLNKQVGQQYGLVFTLIINAIVILTTVLLVFGAIQVWPERFDSFLTGSGASFEWKWWYVFPGLFGFAVIFGLPICMNQLGALTVFISFVTAQVLASMLWDTYVDGIPLASMKIVGAVVALLGVILVARS